MVTSRPVCCAAQVRRYDPSAVPMVLHSRGVRVGPDQQGVFYWSAAALPVPLDPIDRPEKTGRDRPTLLFLCSVWRLHCTHLVGAPQSRHRGPYPAAGRTCAQPRCAHRAFRGRVWVQMRAPNRRDSPRAALGLAWRTPQLLSEKGRFGMFDRRSRAPQAQLFTAVSIFRRPGGPFRWFI